MEKANKKNRRIRPIFNASLYPRRAEGGDVVVAAGALGGGAAALATGGAAIASSSKMENIWLASLIIEGVVLSICFFLFIFFYSKIE